MIADDVFARAEWWLHNDPDPVTRQELTKLLDWARQGSPAALADLRDRFSGRLQFGTAGLRGALGAGPNRMNRVSVAHTAAGLAAYLNATPGPPSVVIGFDGRTNSHAFAIDTAEIMAAAGITTYLFARLGPTPLLAFAVRELDATAGVMVTASHNPAGDNGVKIYLGGQHKGAQIVAPVDQEISAHIGAAAALPYAVIPLSSDFELVPAWVSRKYIAATSSLVTRSPVAMRVVHTAMHGVGWKTVEEVVSAAGFSSVIPVPEQQHPDPRFPSVRFPNPEEPGALDLAYALATERSAELIIANDPDADRLAVAVPDDEGWRRLTGNEVGLLLGWDAAERTRARGETGTLACSVVSSPALGQVAADYGLRFVETLTGFKHIARVPDLIFGFEEALGYLVDPAKVSDKDGISAAVAVLDLASRLKREGRSLDDRLLEAAHRFGAHASEQVSIRTARVSDITETMARLRRRPPAVFAGADVVAVDDFLHDVREFAPTDVLRFRLADGSRIIVRPSGTEPKLKAYIDTHSVIGRPEERIRMARARARDLADGVQRELRGASAAGGGLDD
ncbi:phospho-sugar mutase [Leifsonia shinshuensis]|uniref:phospho-sugar mutase n=1 Tax=Leifsonia shinshuensis TaxID=150026 RepID=UPI002856858B|nr:phospho-sugar mutase [Leifsonia shinshuensis]MDR6971656.1 phosphomannomutase [Leifsonia shinshuensis]